MKLESSTRDRLFYQEKLQHLIADEKTAEKSAKIKDFSFTLCWNCWFWFDSKRIQIPSGLLSKK